VEQLSDKVCSILSSLADSLGTTLPHLWGVLTRQIVLEAWVGLVAPPFVVFGALLGSVFVKRWVNSPSATDDREFAYIIYVILASVVAAISIEIAISSAVSLFNPEYYALERLTILMRTVGH
jgi:hypothetical protein